MIDIADIGSGARSSFVKAVNWLAVLLWCYPGKGQDVRIATVSDVQVESDKGPLGLPAVRCPFVF